jgi:hypothetical protein
VKGILTPEQQAQFSQIQRDAEFEQLKQAVYGKPQPQTGASGGGTPSGAAVDVETVVAKLQFSPNDPALAALRIKYANNPQGLIEAAADLRLQQFQTPNPSPGTALPQNGVVNQQGGMTDAEAEQKSIKLNRLYDNYSANQAEIKALEKELETHWARK